VGAEDKDKRILEFRAKRAEELKEIEAALSKEKEQARKQARREKIAAVLGRAEKFFNGVEPTLWHLAASGLVYQEFGSVAVALVVFATLQTLAGINRHH
jgi:hypothetical protein